MAQTLRLHVFPPANDEGIIPPTSKNDLDEFAVEELFYDYFGTSPHASLRYDQPEIVSRIFEERDDNLETIDELERRLRELYPKADVLRVRAFSERDDRDGPEWEYDIDIIIQVANLETDSPRIRWQYGEDLYGKGLTPPGASASEHIALTNGHNLWGVNIESGEASWSVTLPERTSRSPILVGQAVIVKTKDGHIAYSIESGEKRWTADDPSAGVTPTRHITLNGDCYYGDSEGTIWELSSTGDCRAICELGERIIAVYPTAQQVYALMRGEGKSGLTPGTLHAVDRTSGDEQWVFEPEQKLNRKFAAGPEYVFVSTGREMSALRSDSGDIAWTKSPTEPSADEEDDTATGNKNNRDSDAGATTPDEWKVDWKSKKTSSIKRGQSMSFTARPLFDDALFAPTSEGLLRIEPSTGDVVWKALTRDENQKRLSWGSPPTHDQEHIYIGASDSVYAIDKQNGEQKWEFETPGNPGTMTFDTDTESLTFVTQGLAVNVAVDEIK
jgi:outer membrane protein assembly factor BamB